MNKKYFKRVKPINTTSMINKSKFFNWNDAIYNFDKDDTIV